MTYRYHTDPNAPIKRLTTQERVATAIIVGACLIAIVLLCLLGSLANAELVRPIPEHRSFALKACFTCREQPFPTEAACIEAAKAESERLGPTRTSGAATLTCVIRHNVLPSFRPNPTPTCPTAPAPRTQTCPQGFTGSWQQTASVGPPAACTITWSPMTAPVDACTPIPPSGTATLNWTHNGVDTIGYRIVYGASATALTSTVQINSASQQTHTIRDLAPGTLFFAVKAFNANGESAASNVISKVVR